MVLPTPLYQIVAPNSSASSGNKYAFAWTLMSSSQLPFTQKQTVRQNTPINSWNSIFKSGGIDFKLTGPDGFPWLSLPTTTCSTQPLALHCSWPPKASCPVLELRSSMNQKLRTHQTIIRNWQMALSARWLCLKLGANRTSAMLKNIWLSRPTTAETLHQTIKLETWCDWISETFTTADALQINWTWKLMNPSESFRKSISMYIN